MGFILVGRKKETKNKWMNMGPYEFDKKSDFGSLSRLKRNTDGYDLQLILK